MNNKVGLWINFKHAVLVINPNQEEVIKQIASRINKRTLIASQAVDVSKADSEKALISEKKHYYDEVISYLRTANHVLIMGPGKAKIDLQKRLAVHGFDEQKVVVKAAKKMTDKQIVEDVHLHFQTTQ